MQRADFARNLSISSLLFLLALREDHCFQPFYNLFIDQFHCSPLTSDNNNTNIVIREILTFNFDT